MTSTVLYTYTLKSDQKKGRELYSRMVTYVVKHNVILIIRKGLFHKP